MLLNVAMASTPILTASPGLALATEASYDRSTATSAICFVTCKRRCGDSCKQRLSCHSPSRLTCIFACHLNSAVEEQDAPLAMWCVRWYRKRDEEGSLAMEISLVGEMRKICAFAGKCSL